MTTGRINQVTVPRQADGNEPDRTETQTAARGRTAQIRPSWDAKESGLLAKPPALSYQPRGCHGPLRAGGRPLG